MQILDSFNSEAAETNFAEGIARMMNNRSLYVRLLTKFHTTDNISALRAAVASGIPDQIRMEAHTLKGVAANLSLAGLSNKAADLDHAVKDGHMDQVAALMQIIEESYAITMTEVAAYIAG
ncbi:MAG: Hpt domain-containing protein [Symbiobacteriaceae bacterium]|nr:Hpt domain-containing protein [Symbiobacteriaceae bacterium]